MINSDNLENELLESLEGLLEIIFSSKKTLRQSSLV